MPIVNEFSIAGTVLMVVVTGEVNTAEELEHNTTLVLQHMLKVGCTRVLADDRNLKIDVNTLDIFKAASKDAESIREMPAEKFGVILPPELAEDAKFYENVAHNRGFRIRFFFDQEEARCWIHE
ncbi:hypothetical protein KQI52_14400 [bacterium]|nr:hypothetical protein [bacterium]